VGRDEHLFRRRNPAVRRWDEAPWIASGMIKPGIQYIGAAWSFQAN
jgi:hypothetical protein